VIPTAGRIVHYTLTAQDAEAINARREAGAKGNAAHEGDVLPMLIIRVWGDQPQSSVNGQVFADGDFSLWVTSVAVGEGPRHWAWPARA
jgi:hypothetical protein